MCLLQLWVSLLGTVNQVAPNKLSLRFYSTFEKLEISIWGLTNAFCIACYISGLKEEIRAQIWTHNLATWLEACEWALLVEIVLNAQSTCPSIISGAWLDQIKMSLQHPKIQWLSLVKMEKWKWCGHCYHCDEKKSPITNVKNKIYFTWTPPLPKYEETWISSRRTNHHPSFSSKYFFSSNLNFEDTSSTTKWSFLLTMVGLTTLLISAWLKTPIAMSTRCPTFKLWFPMEEWWNVGTTMKMWNSNWGIIISNPYVFYWYGWLWYCSRGWIIVHLGSSHIRFQGIVLDFYSKFSYSHSQRDSSRLTSNDKFS